MKRLNKYLLILLSSFCILSLSSCDPEVTIDDELQGTWRLQQISYTYRNENGVLINAFEEGSIIEKFELLELTKSIKPFITSYTCNAVYLNGSWYNVEDGGDIDYTINGNILTIKAYEGGTFYQLVNAASLLRPMEQLILTFKKGGYEDEDDPDPVIENPEEDGYILSTMEYEPYRHPLYENYPDNLYSEQKNHLITLYQDDERTICIGYKYDKLWLLVYEIYQDHWHILQDIVDYDYYWNNEYIFFSVGQVITLNTITEKREFNSGNGKTPTSFALENINDGFVIGFKVNNVEKFIRIRAKDKNNGIFIMEYSYF
ncbi:MAG: hypothetical protein LBP67_04615 [Bacteroidales bacterium]|jgi:hypothetical protein|nr:hypothetical protein [Bacteroidales bacterium]